MNIAIETLTAGFRAKGISVNPVPPANRLYLAGYGSDISAYIDTETNEVTVISSDGFQSAADRAGREDRVEREIDAILATIN